MTITDMFLYGITLGLGMILLDFYVIPGGLY